MASPATLTVEVKPLRAAGAAMLGIAAVRPLVGGPGVPCPLRTLTGVPCPFCGMTRGVTSLVHGDLGHALLMNPGSFFVVAVAVALLVGVRRSQLRIPAWLLVAFVAALWTFQLFKYSTGRPL